MIVTRSLPLGTQSCSLPLSWKLSFTWTKYSSTSPGLRLAPSSFSRSQRCSSRKRFRSAFPSAGDQLVLSASVSPLTRSTFHCCLAVELATGLPSAPFSPLRRLTTSCARRDAVVVFRDDLQRERRVRRAVLAAAGLLDLHGRHRVLADDQLVLLRAGVLEAVFVRCADDEPHVLRRGKVCRPRPRRRRTLPRDRRGLLVGLRGSSTETFSVLARGLLNVMLRSTPEPTAITAGRSPRSTVSGGGVGVGRRR